MGKINKVLKSRINEMYFDRNMTIPKIQLGLGLSYNNVLNAIERGDVYNFRRSNSPKNNYSHVMLIADEVSNYFRLTKGIINKKTRIREVIIPRQIAHTIAYNLTKSSNSFIGKFIGSKNSATVTHSRKVINGLLSYKNEVSDDYLAIEIICKNKIENEKN